MVCVRHSTGPRKQRLLSRGSPFVSLALVLSLSATTPSFSRGRHLSVCVSHFTLSLDVNGDGAHACGSPVGSLLFPLPSLIMAVSLVWKLLSIKSCFCHDLSKAIGFGVRWATRREPGCCCWDLLQVVLLDEKPSESAAGKSFLVLSVVL